MRRKNLGNAIVKRAIVLAMCFMVGITTLAGTAITAKAEGTNDVVKALDTAEEKSTIMSEEVTIPAITDDDKKNGVELKSDDVLADEQCAEKDVIAAGEAISKIENAIAAEESKVGNSYNDAVEAAEKSDAAATGDAYDDLDDAVKAAEYGINNGFKNSADAKETLDNLDAATEEAKTALKDAEEQYDISKKKYEEALEEYNAAKAMAESDETKKLVEEAKEKLEHAKADLADAIIKAEEAQERVDAAEQLLGELLDAMSKSNEENAQYSYAKADELLQRELVEHAEDPLFEAAYAQILLTNKSIEDYNAAKLQLGASQTELTNIRNSEGAAEKLDLLYLLDFDGGAFLRTNLTNGKISELEFKRVAKAFDTLGNDASVEAKLAAIDDLADILDASTETEMSQACIKAFTEAWLNEGDTEDAKFRHEYIVKWSGVVSDYVNYASKLFGAVENTLDTYVVTSKVDSEAVKAFQKEYINAKLAELNFGEEKDTIKGIVAYYKENTTNGLKQKAQAALDSAIAAQNELAKLQFTAPDVTKLNELKNKLDVLNEEYQFIEADIQGLSDLIDKAEGLKVTTNDKYESLKKKENNKGNGGNGGSTGGNAGGGTSTGTVVTPSNNDTATAPTATRTTRRAQAAPVVEEEEIETEEIEETETPLASEASEDEAVTEDVVETATVEDEVVPQAAEVKKMNWWWLILIAIAAALGITGYEVNKKKKAQAAETKNEK